MSIIIDKRHGDARAIRGSSEGRHTYHYCPRHCMRCLGQRVGLQWPRSAYPVLDAVWGETRCVEATLGLGVDVCW
jgi:hypothetical protein